ncbi:hypothetical protein BJ912DRAFT_952845 [Pholiota molesta]|nr:hypothetical protein BJ912DRAFT_952845 [Pholiota molesta]
MLNRLSGLNGRLPPARLLVRTFTQTPPVRRFHVGKFLLIGAAAGTVGGGLIVGAGYAWYRYSGLHHFVERFKPAALFLAKTRSELGAEAPTHVLRHFRAACKAYLAHLPGAGFLVDRAFDSIDDAVDAHAQEANAIIATACHKVSMIVARKRDAPDGNSAVEIMSIARQLAKDLGALGNLDLENTSTAAFDMAKSKSAEVSQKLAGATEKAKDIVQNSNASETIVEKAKSLFTRSEK